MTNFLVKMVILPGIAWIAMWNLGMIQFPDSCHDDLKCNVQVVAGSVSSAAISTAEEVIGSGVDLLR